MSRPALSILRLLVSMAFALGHAHVACCDEAPVTKNAPMESASKVQAALHEIFADEHCPESPLGICERAARMEVDEKYDYLLNQVVPNVAVGTTQTPTVRIVIAFSPTDPAPPVAGELPASGHRLPSGGALISPALELVDAAAASGQLDALFARLQSVPENGVLAQKNRCALMAMVLTAQGKSAEAMKELERLIPMCSQPQADNEVVRAAELVVAEKCSVLNGADELLLGVLENVVARQKKTYSNSPWFRQFRGRQAVLMASRATSDAGETTEAAAQWASARAMSAFTRGSGIPSSKWVLSAGRAANTSSHGDDYLYFAVPMRGQFQIECDTSAFGWTETRPFVAGQWASPVYDHVNVEFGNLRVAHPRQPISPALTRITDSIHMRAAVANQQITTSANGRVIHQHVIPPKHDPWIGLRSGSMQEGWASNVRVTGSPEIPDTIEMTATTELEGWIPYYDGVMGGHWLSSDGDGLRGRRDGPSEQLPAGRHEQLQSVTYREEAVFYNRPMLEDGTIEYEFYYEEGHRCAHVVLDRLCFLVRPDGVRIHWLTDGKYERSELRPDNETIEPSNRLSAEPLRLQNGNWNRMTLKLAGDIVELSLNGSPVYRRTLESTNQRRFGFFHYADQEELTVRNVRWSGSWPKALPDVSHQALATPEGDFLDTDDKKLTALYEHNFAVDGIGDDVVSMIQGAAKTNFNMIEQGVSSVAVGTGGYRNATLAPRVSAEGDFDIIAEYDNFDSQPPLKGSSTIMLLAILNNKSHDEFAVTRRHMSHTPENQQQILQCIVVSTDGDNVKRDYFTTKTMEDRGGRMRLSRRGGKMYFLSAEGDSPNFRLWGTRDCALDPVQVDGIRLLNQIHEIGQTGVVWKNVIVKAERLSGPALGESDGRILKLNKQRESLVVHKVYDLTTEPPSETALYRWGDHREWLEEDRGLPILAPGATNWTSSGISSRQPIVGDFDVRVEFDNIRLMKPKTGLGTAVFLQADFSDDKKTQVSAIFNMTDSGVYEFDGQIRTNDAAGKPTYRNNGRRSTMSASALRMARNGTTLTIISQADPSAEERIVTEFQVSDAAVPSVKLLVHTGGPVGDSEVTLKAMEIHANYYEPLLIDSMISGEIQDQLLIMHEDGSGVQVLTAPQPPTVSHGSPDWSPDGSLIAFDTWSGQANRSRIMLVKPDGTGTQDLGEGVMPDFSPDSRRIAFSWAGNGIAIMNRDGSNRKVINAEGWGARWSPNGQWLACSISQDRNNQRTVNLAVIDIITGDVRPLFSGPDATRYVSIAPTMEWSPDNKWLCFKGRTAEDATELAIVGVPDVSDRRSSRVEQSARLRVIPVETSVYDFAWHPSGRSILLSVLNPNLNLFELKQCVPLTGRISSFPGQPPKMTFKTLGFSPDGKKIVFSSVP